MGRILVIAFRNILASPLRTSLIGGGIVLVTMLWVLMLGIAGGVQESMVRVATTLSAGAVNVGGFYKTSASIARPIVADYAKVEKVIREAVPDLTYITRRARGGFDRITSAKTSLQNAIVGIDVKTDRRLFEVLTILEGKLEDLAEPRTALVFKHQADDLGVKVGDTLTITGTTLRNIRNTVDVRVAAIAQDMGAMSMFGTYIPEQTVNELYQIRGDATGAFFIGLKNRDDAPEVAATLRSAMEKAGYEVLKPESQPFWMKIQNVAREDWIGQKLDVTTWREEMGDLVSVVDALGPMATVLSIILLIIIVIGIVITMQHAVRVRTPEVGTLRAIGMSSGRVMLMFLLEVALLATMATTLGAALGLGITSAINSAAPPITDLTLQFLLMSDHLVLAFSPSSVLLPMFAVVVLTTLGALYPAYRATRIQPGTAMQAAT
ncbi:MAG: FtsX-like permease family protein [Myxococcota bacterium]